MNEKTKSGFVTIIGRPNVGKSTLLNQLLGTKVSIVTNKPQTTRNNIRGILTKNNSYQIVFLDTPGIHDSKNLIDNYMNSSAFKSTKGTDVVLFLAPVNEPIGKNDLYIAKQLRDRKDFAKILVLTKADTLKKEELLKKVLEWKEIVTFDDVVLISALENKNLDELLKIILSKIPEGPFFYDEAEVTDQPNRFYIQEIIREKILFKTGQEIPHSVAILVEYLEETDENLEINASIYVERESQKGIIVGSGGKKIKDIKYLAKKELKDIFQKEIDLDLVVRVKKDWRKSPSLIKMLGYDKNKY